MTAFKTILAGGVAAAALLSAAPAAAQYYPNYGSGGGVVGQVINQVLGGGAYGGYGINSQAAIDRCAAAVTDRVNREYGNRYGGYSPYGGYGTYGGYGGYNSYAGGGARVLGVTSVERRSGGGLRVRGVATANANTGYGGYGGYSGYGGYGGYGGYQQAPAELSFKCNVDYRGYITDIDLDRNSYAYGYRRY